MGKKNKKKNIKTKVKKKRRIKYKNIIIFLIIVLLIVILYFKIFNVNLSTVYVTGNKILTDEEVIQIAKISKKNNDNSILNIKKRLENNKYILSAKVSKKNYLKDVYIEIEENRPLFIYNDETVLIDGTKVKEKYNIPIVINEIDSSIYEKFLDKFSNIDDSILTHISEIKYDPNDVDKKRFLFTINDGNYVYVTLNSLTNVNEYLKIIKNFEGKKGILYLDSGKYFQVIE